MVVAPQCSPVVTEILRTHAGRQLPLQQTDEAASAALSLVVDAAPEHLFPAARAPVEAHAGLVLWLGDWTRAHDMADIESQDAYYWHAIIHRIEPDSNNAGYWFRKVGSHPIFDDLLIRANEILEEASGECAWSLPREWDPFLFIRWCEEARRQPRSASEEVARRIQQAEWELLFSRCTQAVPSENNSPRPSSRPA